MTTTSTTDRADVFAAFCRVCRVDRHLSVLTRSALTRTSGVTSFNQLHAQAVLDGSSLFERLQFTTLSHHAEQKDAMLEQREGFQDH